jgi:hypothetical protein
MMHEKEEACPTCGEIKRWLYDAQICAACGHGDRYAASRKKQAASALLVERVAKAIDVVDHRKARSMDDLTRMIARAAIAAVADWNAISEVRERCAEPAHDVQT